LPSDRRGTAALEFALVATPFVGLVLGLATLGLNLYLQHALDVALLMAVRQVQLGTVPATDSASDFTSQVFCPVFITFAPCANLVLTVQPVANFASAPVTGGTAAQSSGSFCVGAPGQLMYAQVLYLAPLISNFWPYSVQATVGGKTGAALTAGAGWANENASGATPSTATGC
jgi:Flp pilus assembly protein TadG